MDSIYSESAKGPMAFPDCSTEGMDEMIMMMWAIPQMATPWQIILKRPYLVSASQPKNTGRA